MSKALLICNGEALGPWLKKWAKQANFILAADGGADRALNAGIVPDAVIGDLDSVSAKAKRKLAQTPFIHVKRQDNTDLEKALDWLVKQHFEECVIIGAFGGRLDFTFGNMLTIYPYLHKIRLSFRGKNWSLFPLTESFTFQARIGTRMSILPLAPCKDITLKGVRYRLTKANWKLGQAGLSNIITKSQTEINFQSGYMLLYVED